VYFGSMTAQLKMVLERIGYVSGTSGDMLKRKVGAAIAVQGHHGGCSVLSEMTGFMLDNRMTVCGSSSLTVLTGRKPSEILKDKEGMTSLKDLGKEMAWLLYQLRK
jgi:multimeric flavodoxin WrbA